MRFSIWPNLSEPWEEVVDLVRHCEATGWDGVYYADHFMPNTDDGAPADGPVLECGAVLAGLAASVPRLRIGSLVVGNTYRHPAVLANMAATIDHISGGRFVLGLGAGWQANEHEAYGIPLFDVKERLDRFDEACQIVTSLLRQRRTTVAGTYYQVTDAPCDPKPVQERVPLLIGAKGKRRALRIVARYADEWNMWSWPDLLREHREVLHRHCDEIGRDPADIKVSTQALLYLADTSGKGPEPPAGARITVAGTPAAVVDTIAAYRDAGVDEFIVPTWTMPTLSARKDTCDRFMADVAAAFR
jgi:F420-dependent oxidoreductase-like protein